MKTVEQNKSGRDQVVRTNAENGQLEDSGRLDKCHVHLMPGPVVFSANLVRRCSVVMFPQWRPRSEFYSECRVLCTGGQRARLLGVLSVLTLGYRWPSCVTVGDCGCQPLADSACQPRWTSHVSAAASEMSITLWHLCFNKARPSAAGPAV